jgi:hypothetical protein
MNKNIHLNFIPIFVTLIWRPFVSIGKERAAIKPIKAAPQYILKCIKEKILRKLLPKRGIKLPKMIQVEKFLWP